MLCQRGLSETVELTTENVDMLQVWLEIGDWGEWTCYTRLVGITAITSLQAMLPLLTAWVWSCTTSIKGPHMDLGSKVGHQRCISIIKLNCIFYPRTILLNKVN